MEKQSTIDVRGYSSLHQTDTAISLELVKNNTSRIISSMMSEQPAMVNPVVSLPDGIFIMSEMQYHEWYQTKLCNHYSQTWEVPIMSKGQTFAHMNLSSIASGSREYAILTSLQITPAVMFRVGGEVRLDARIAESFIRVLARPINASPSHRIIYIFVTKCEGNAGVCVKAANITSQHASAARRELGRFMENSAKAGGIIRCEDPVQASLQLYVKGQTFFTNNLESSIITVIPRKIIDHGKMQLQRFKNICSWNNVKVQLRVWYSDDEDVEIARWPTQCVDEPHSWFDYCDRSIEKVNGIHYPCSDPILVQPTISTNEGGGYLRVTLRRGNKSFKSSFGALRRMHFGLACEGDEEESYRTFVAELMRDFTVLPYDVTSIIASYFEVARTPCKLVYGVSKK